MKANIIITIAAAGIFVAGGAFTAEPTTVDRLKDAAADAGDALQRAGNIIAQESREAWTKTKAYFSDDPETYKTGARQKLEELNAEVTRIRDEAATIAGRPYFQTRITALEQQHQFARQQFEALTPDEIRQGTQGPRRHLDALLGHLEDHLNIAQREVQDIRNAKP